jgi:hypothetical protein
VVRRGAVPAPIAFSCLTAGLLAVLTIPLLLLPLRPLILRSFDRENMRTNAAVKKYAEAHPGGQ